MDKQRDIASVKTRLLAYLDMEREIENQLQYLELLDTKLIGLGAQTLTDMPGKATPSNDRLTDLMALKFEVEQSIAENAEKHRRERQQIESILGRVKQADQRAVIRYRYFLGMNWCDVAQALFGGEVDYLSREESYIRRTTKLHGRALVSIAQCMAKSRSTSRPG